MQLPKLDDLLALLPDKRSRDLALAAGGVVLLLGGRKVLALATFTRALRGLEERWREVHEFDGDLAERLKRAAASYEATHQDATNRKLHVVGVPIVVGGTLGLLVFPAYRPLWLLSAGAFTAGLALHLVGHGVFEKSAAGFADDPLAFLVGPLSSLRLGRGRRRAARDDEGVIDIDGVNVRPGDPALA